MLDIGSSELLLIVIVAVVVIGPKDLPRVLYKLGQIIGKGRAMTRHFRAGIDEMIRQAELDEMEKKWAADNARIMSQTPSPPAEPIAPDASTGVAGLLPEPPPETARAFDVDPAQHHAPEPASDEATAEKPAPPHDVIP